MSDLLPESEDGDTHEVLVYEIGLANEADFGHILRLQEENSSTVVPKEKQSLQGFVTLRTDEELLREINEIIGITVARAKGIVVGYMMPMTMEQVSRMDLFIPFIEMFPHVLLGDKTIEERVKEGRICMGGQVCIDPKHRGGGIVQAMGREFVMRIAQNYDYIISEINVDNLISIHVNIRKLRFQSLGFYTAGGTNWMIIGKDLRVDRMIEGVSRKLGIDFT